MINVRQTLKTFCSNPNQRSFMANLFLFLLLTVQLISPNYLLFSIAGPTVSSNSPQSPSPATILPPPSSPLPIINIFPAPPPSSPPPIINITPVPLPSSSPPIINITPVPLPSSSPLISTITPPPPPPTVTINTPTPPPHQLQLDNIIDALIGAGDFAGWANILSNTNPSSLPLSATFFIPGNNALSHLPTSTASGSIDFDPFIIPYHIIPQRLSFSDLLLFKPQTRLPTLLPTKSILITNNSPANFSVDNSPITHPDMYTNSDVSVHGIEAILDYTTFGGNPFQPPVQQAQIPPSEVANDGRSDSTTMGFTDYHLVFSIICAVFAFNIDMERVSKANIALILCGLCFAVTAHGVSVDKFCAFEYFKDGAPAVFQSSKCTQWVQEVNSLKNNTVKCDLATRQGHQPYQEDHMTCNLVKMPLLGSDRYKVYVIALFDGHGGAEASEMANQKFLDYFLIHEFFGGHQAFISIQQPDNSTSPPTESMHFEPDYVSFHNHLKKALLHALHDIDREFSSEAFKKHYYGGSSATVVLLLNEEEILVASLGDSPALLCKGRKRLRAEKLTRNHHPDEEDERARIEAAGGFVQVVEVPRVNGRLLAVSRAIGDISFKRYGVIAEPEVNGWRKLASRDCYLVVASGGIFKGGLSPEDICKIIEQGGNSISIVKAAVKKRSFDNLSAILLPLKQPSEDEL